MGSDSGGAAQLWEVAFGGRPIAVPVPVPESRLGKWLRAVVLGAAGFYAAAQTQLEDITRQSAAPETGAEEALAYSTWGSLQRQCGRYQTAAVLDGRALAIVTGRAPSSRNVIQPADGASALCREAWCDAITGLAADAIGAHRFAVAGRLLDRLDVVVDGRRHEGDLWRQRLRRDWVRCELALYSGDPGAGRRWADAAVERARSRSSVRHQIKSELMAAAAMHAGANPAGAAALAWRCLEAAESHDLYPLAWASAQLLSNDPAANERSAAFARVLRRRGGVFA
ncbi:hypothetical protein ONR57_04225 [Hoyosella sp. YIM 151337]|uniref:hypothetical protein n=1 Tax=Hoyosella sp. YIM 151337 TaxID=2992742 RepID=UPI002235A8CB|nr:hypothetical protein [Hoyosella sp. YIM 151337]MCW4352507.1 hypothetical protein [Hoyosella sp. YIM 151337]